MGETALQPPVSVQEEGRRCSRHEEAHRGASCPPTAHGHHTEQISMHSHGGAHCAAVDEAWRRHSPRIPLQEQPCARAAAPGEKSAVGQEGWRSCHLWDCAGAVPEGWAPWDGAVLKQCWESCTQNRWWKDGVPWEGAMWSRVTMEEPQGRTLPLVCPHPAQPHAAQGQFGAPLVLCLTKQEKIL